MRKERSLTMAKEYIERESFVDHLENAKEILWHDISLSSMYAAKLVDIFLACAKVFPTVEAAPVRHGHIIWKRRRRGGFRHAKCLHRFCNFVIEDNAPCKHIAKIDERYTTDEPYCSECGKLLGDFLNYCGNCGAKMDGDKNG